MNPAFEQLLKALLPTLMPQLIGLLRQLVAGWVKTAYEKAKETESQLDDLGWQGLAAFLQIDLEAA